MTKGIKAVTIASLEEKNGIDLTKTWDIISPMLATNLGAGLYLERKARKLILVRNTTGTEFITGDQPTINLVGETGKPVETVVTYYPVSPFLALILTATDGSSPFPPEGLTIDWASGLFPNARMAKASHRQIFGRAEFPLIKAREDALHLVV